ncbi:NAD(P)-dependent dehydrogenase, short-chain alcohol dehydrogenase family [Micromonospora citrea]|uniref:NAD(P)-dependent dehydrogenase, short-chain alcohol dehydrogenase family n=1 Tax=Micromonospora citrea TaxID=47855 RepID=A0A1C6V0C7_9ACTN|nr:SDR family oxidoreductase [Micromonospora citrea]SCL59721.1 NAD(P)-dependent dehydrogenase, short-chain alcohol dehydrogenase family [Micromonospora citrea]
MASTTIALVTGANKGLGRETVRRLAGLGWQVFLAARDTTRGMAAAAELVEDGLNVEFVPLDVTSDESVAAAAGTVKARAGRLDVLVNNAGIGGTNSAPADTTAFDLREVFEVNVFGPVRVTHAFLPLLRAAEQPRIVMVSSGMGSVATITDPNLSGLVPPTLAYPASKSALNMITTQYASALSDIKVNAVDPGYTATDMNNNSGFQTVTEGTDAIVRLADIGPDGPTGGFFDRTGPVSW